MYRMIVLLAVVALLVQQGACFSLLEDVLAAPLRLFGRELEKDYYYKTNSRDDDIGVENLYASAGNPLKGLVANPGFGNFDPSVDNIDVSLDFYNVGLSEILVDDPDVVGVEAAFDWSALEQRLEESATRKRHVVLSFMVHWPGKSLFLPQYLVDKGVEMYNYYNFLGGGRSPFYGDPILLRAIEQFVTEMGARYECVPDIELRCVCFSILTTISHFSVLPS